MTWPDLAKLLDRHDGTRETSDAAHAGALAALLILLLAAGFSAITQWTVDGLRAPQVLTVAE